MHALQAIIDDSIGRDLPGLINPSSWDDVLEDTRILSALNSIILSGLIHVEISLKILRKKNSILHIGLCFRITIENMKSSRSNHCLNFIDERLR